MTTTKLCLAFAGTTEFAKVVLESLLQKNVHDVSVVFTQPDRRAGRGRKLTQSVVKQYALTNGLIISQPTTTNEFDLAQLNGCDLMLVVAYGLLITPAILAKPKYGCINIHPSLLPRWRGAAPIQRAIEAGDSETGISIMQMDEGLDTGPVLAQHRCLIKDDDTAGDVHDRLAEISAVTINTTLNNIINNQLDKLPQDNLKQSYANKITQQETDLDWSKSAVELARKIRAFNPSPGTRSTLNAMPMKIWSATAKSNRHSSAPVGTVLKNTYTEINVVTGSGILQINTLQLAGKKVITAKDFLNGHPHFFN